MVQVGLKGFAKTRVFRSISNTATRKTTLSKRSIGCGKLIKNARPNLGVELHGRD